MRNYLLLLFIALSLVGFYSPVHSQLSGAYTIDPGNPASATNYQNFASAVGDMATGTRTDGGPVNGPAVSAQVTFSVAAATYSEQVTIPSIAGASATNQIIFDGTNPATRIISRNSTSTGDYVVRLDGADFITLSNLSVVNTGSTYGFGIQLINQANDNQIEGCIVTLPPTGTNNYQVGIIGATTYSTYALSTSNLTISDCEISGGRYNIVVNGPSGTQATGLTIDGNELTGAYYAAIRLNYMNQPEISDNLIDLRVAYNFAYGMYLRYCSELDVNSNTISNPGGYGIYQFNTNYNTNNYSDLYNNMIGGEFHGTSTSYGLYMSSCRNTRIYHNSVLVDNPGSNSRGLYITSSNSTGLDVQNNSFAANNPNGTAHAAYVVNSSYVDIMDYNNYYSSGPNLIRLSADYGSLGAAQTAVPTLNQNSQEGWPNYNSSSDLHAFGTQLSNWATNITAINTDIDGQSRPLPPDPVKDVGADEYNLPPFDLDIVGIPNPTVLVLGNNTIEMTVQTNGSQSLNGTPVTCQYSTDGGTTWGVTQTFTPASLGSPGNQETFIFTTPWNVTSTANQDLCVRIFPLVTGDPDASDVFCKNLCVGMTGTYTINGALATGGTNFNTFADAVSALSTCGVNGAVNIDIAPGTYNEFVELGPVTGASATNTITFDGGTAVQCTLLYSFSTTNQAMVRLNGADYTRFRNMTLDIPGNYGYGFWLNNQADHNEITDCVIFLPQGTTTGYHSGIVMSGNFYYSSGNSGNYNLIQNNRIQGGYYGIRCNGIGSTSYTFGNRFIDNEISQFYYAGIYNIYQSDIEIINNEIRGRLGGGSNSGYGIYSSYTNGVYKIEYNKVTGVGARGLYLAYSNLNNPTGRGLVNNNMLGGGFYTTSSAYGLYMYNVKDVDVINNSCNIGGMNGDALYISGTTGNVDSVRIVNNVFAAEGSYLTGGLAFRATTGGANGIQALDYNLYFSTGVGGIIYWINGGYTGMGPWQTVAPTFNQNSLIDQPGFISETDLHFVCSPAENQGIYLGISDDHDGDMRSTSTPDIGADEFTGTTITYTAPADTSACAEYVIYGDTANYAGFIWNNTYGAPSDSLLVDSTDVYYITVIDSNNCRATDSMAITINDYPFRPFNNDSVATCSYDTVDAQNAGATYLWNTMEVTQTIVPTATGTYTVDITSPAGCTTTDNIYVLQYADAVADLGPDTTYCLGVGAVLDAGTAPTGTDYDWNNGANSQVLLITAPGMYAVTVTSPDGCVAEDSIMMNALLAPVVELGPDRTECDDLVLDAQNPGETYAWNTTANTQTINVTSSGTYTVTVTNSGGCSTVDNVIINISAAPVVNLGGNQVLCANQTVTLDAGNPGFQHNWSNGPSTQTIQVSNPGTYLVSVTDPGTNCIGVDSISVGQSFLSVNLGNDFTLCTGQTQMIDAGTGPTGYLWQDGSTNQTFTVSGPGMYSVQVTDNSGCSVGDSVQVTAAAPPTANFTHPGNSPMLQMVPFTDNSSGGTSYLWDFGDGQTSTAQNPSHTYVAIGTFTVCQTVSNGTCENTFCSDVTIAAPVGIEDELFANSVSVYPNPNSGEFSIDFDLPKHLDLTVDLFNLTGQTVFHSELSGVRVHNENVSLDQRAAGIYFLRILSDKGHEMIRKVIVE